MSKGDAPARPDSSWLDALDAWGEAEILRPLSGGRNRLYEILLEGRPCVARRSAQSAPSLAWEIDLLESLAGEGFTVPVPLPSRHGDSSHQGIVVMPRLRGAPPSTSDEWRRVAQILRRLHGLTRDWPRRPDSVGAIDQPQVAGEINLALLPPSARDACLDAWRSLSREAAGKPSSVVHGDPHAGNILIDGDTIALLDWDEARVDASILDIAALPPAHVEAPAWARRAVDAWEVACSWRREPAYARERLAALRGDNC